MKRGLASEFYAACWTAAILAAVLAVPAGAMAQTPAPRQQEQRQTLPVNIPGLDAEVHFDSFDVGAGGVITLSGYVDINHSPEWRLQADRVAITPPQDPDVAGAEYSFEATGNVTLEGGEVRLNGTRMTGNLLAGTGTIENAVGVGPGGIYFRGSHIEQRAPGVFHIIDGVVTPCTQALPIWEFSARSFDLYADDHVTMKLPVFKIKGVPFIVLPALYWPIDKGHRSTGLMMPGIGNSTRKGFMYSQPVFWAIDRSQDATLTYDYYSLVGSAFSAEYRHRLTSSSAGDAHFFWAQGSDFTDEEIAAGADQVPGGWSLDGAHLQSLPSNWRVNANANFFSSKEFIQGFEDNFNSFLRRNSSAGFFLTRSWSSYTLNIVADHNETFFGNVDSVVRRREPEIEFRVRRRPLYQPLYVQFEGSYAGLLREERGPAFDPRGGRYQRIDAFPEVSLPFTQIPWLTFTPFLAWRSTYYNQRNVAGDFDDDPIFRNVYETGIQVIGPSLFRIFDTPTSGYSPRYKHILEPRFTWGRRAELEHLGFTNRQIIQFDEIDAFGGSNHFARFSLTNRLLAKRFSGPRDEERTVWEVFSVELARDFDLRESDPAILFPSIPLPWSVGARVTPTRAINIAATLRFTREWKPGGFTMNGNINSGVANANITWFRSARAFPDEDDPSIVDITSRDRLSGSARVNLFRALVTLQGNLTWDVSERLLQAVMIGGTYNTQCCSIGAQLRKTNFSFRDELQFSVLIELLNVGQLGFGSEGR